MKTLFTLLVLISITLNSSAQSNQIAVNMSGTWYDQEETSTLIADQNVSYEPMIPANFQGHHLDEKIKAKGNFLTKILFGPDQNIITLLRGSRKSTERSSARRSTKHQVAAVPYSNRVDHAVIYAGSAMPQNIGSYPQAVHHDPQTSNGMQPSALPYTPGQNLSNYQQPLHDNTQPIYSGQSHPQGQTTPYGQTGNPHQNSYMQQQIPYASGQNNTQYQQLRQNQQPNYSAQSYHQNQANPYGQTAYPRQNIYMQPQTTSASGQNIAPYQQPMQNNLQPNYPVQTYPQGQINSYAQSGYLHQGVAQANGVQSPTAPKRKKQIGKKIFKGLGTVLEIAGDLGVVPGLGMASKLVNKIGN